MNHLRSCQPSLHWHSCPHQLLLQEPPALLTLDLWSRTTHQECCITLCASVTPCVELPMDRLCGWKWAVCRLLAVSSSVSHWTAARATNRRTLTSVDPCRTHRDRVCSVRSRPAVCLLPGRQVGGCFSVSGAALSRLLALMQFVVPVPNTDPCREVRTGCGSKADSVRCLS